MTYATKADLEARFNQGDEIDNLADIKTPGTDGRIEPALKDATAEIDAALATAFNLPLPPGEYPFLTIIACDLARSRLYDDVTLKRPKQLADRARDNLMKIVQGEMQLASVDGQVVQRRDRVQVSEREDPAFSRQNMSGFG